MLDLLKKRSIKFRARYRCGLKQIGSLRFRFGGMFAHAPCWRASSLIQSASYPRSASNIVCGSKALRRTEHSLLSCASPGVSARWTGRPLVSDHRVNLAREASSRATHSLVIVVRDTRSVLVHAHDGGIDHLHRRVMTGGQRFHDLVPDASSPPTSEAILTSGAGTPKWVSLAE